MSGTRQSSPDALQQQGIQLDQAGLHGAATALYRQILEQQPDHAYASHIQEGFNCSVLYQIASELKAKFPDVLGLLHLQNIWGYRQKKTVPRYCNASWRISKMRARRSSRTVRIVR